MRLKMQSVKDVPTLQDCRPVTRIDFGDHYPDGGWGWTVMVAATLVHLIGSGIHYAFGMFLVNFCEPAFKFPVGITDAVWLGSIGVSTPLLLAPLVTSTCRRKSPRLYAVIGGLVIGLGSLFVVFSKQIWHMVISYCLVLSVGTGITTNAASIMVGRYFRLRREIAEMVVASGTGIGAAVLTFLVNELFKNLPWVYMMLTIAGVSAIVMISGTLYRPVSLYHPRRNVIQHIKNQKKCRRDRNQDKPPYFDLTALKMRAIQGLMVIVAVVGLGMYVPFILLLNTAKEHKIDKDDLVTLGMFLGWGYAAGCYIFGYVVIRNSSECSISRRHLAQSCALAGGASTLLFVMARDFHAFALYAWLFGISSGGYSYTLKMYTYSIVKERVMELGWSYICAAQFMSFLLGAPLANYLNVSHSSNMACYVFAGVTMIVGGAMFYIMPIFERHPSNNEIVQRYQSACSKNTTEAAALLDLDLTNAMVTKPLNNVQFIVSPSRMKHNHGKDSSKIQMQCFIQHRDKEKPKQIVLSRITEEKEGLRLDFNEISYVSSNSKSLSEGSVHRKSISDRDPVCASADVPGDCADKSGADKPSKSYEYGRTDSKYHRSSDNVKLEFFDPPSQEKESTATVSYDSDLYINLCEAQV